MTSAKALRVAPIDRHAAIALVRKLHYSGRHVPNSQIHLGVFWEGRAEGVMQFGPSLDKRKVQGLVAGTPWQGFIELNRMAFSDRLPRNSESRALDVALRMLRKAYPFLQWVISFADGCRCGDGTIYRAAGFVLTQIKANTTIWELEGASFSNVAFRTGEGVRKTISKLTATKGVHVREDGSASMRKLKEAGARPLKGYQLRYIYFLDPGARDRMTVPILPFAKIDEIGARMYRGQKIERAQKPAGGDQSPEGRGSTDPPAPANDGQGLSDVGRIGAA